MGNQPSKKSKETSAESYTTELRSYEEACKEDTELQSFDSCLQARTNKVMSTLATDVEVRSLSFDSLKEVTGCLMEMNQDVVKMILNYKEEIWMHTQLFELVRDYLETSKKTLGFCATLKKCLDLAMGSHTMIINALKHFENESFDQGANAYEKTLQELNDFREEEPFKEDFFEMFQSVNKQHTLMLWKLQRYKKKLDKKLKRIHIWRKISGVIFVTTLATVLICSVVAAAMAAPPVAAALAAATAVPLGSMGKWIDSIWKNYEDAVKGQKAVINSMQAGTFVTIKDLDNIRNLTKQLEMEIKGMVNSAKFPVEQHKARIWIDEIKKKLEEYVNNVDKLEIQVDLCSNEVQKARTQVLQRLIKEEH